MNPILMEDLLGYRFLSGITVSPFENRAVFTVAVQDARSNGYKKNLWQVDPFTGKTEKLTSHGKAGAFLFEKAGTLLCQKPGKKPGTTDYEYLEMDTGKTEPAFTLPWAVNKLEKLCGDLYLVNADIDTNYPEDMTEEERKAEEGNGEMKMEDNAEKKETLAEEFSRRVILKVSKIVDVEKHPNGDKLYILKLDCGEAEPRQIVSSIVPYYTIDELMGRNIVLVSNLKPANFRGVKSFGMLLAASAPDDETHSTCELIWADDIAPGTVLKYEGESEVEKVTTYIKPDHFFALPMKTIDGYVTIEGKKLGADGHFLRVEKYVNGNVG